MKKITITIKALAITVLFITSNINGQNTALNFDGTAGASGATMSGQLMFTSPMVPLTNSFTVMGWVNVNNASFTQIFTWGSGTVNKYININTSFDQKIQIFTPSVISLKSTTVISGSWHHVAITNNSGAITIYVDGVNEASGTADFSSITPTETSFGTAFLNGVYQGSGDYDIDEFSIWNIALSGAQILAFKDTPPLGSESGLVAAYNFNPAGVTPDGDNTSLTTLNDLTGNYPGTLFGFPLTGTTGNYITSTNVAPELTYNNNKYDIAKASFNKTALDVSIQEISPRDLLFNNDGSVLYVLGLNGDDINQYNLSTNYDIASASFNSIALSVGTEETSPDSMLFNNDGSVLYVMGYGGDDINQYNLTIPYDISTASFNSIALSVTAQDTNPTDMFFNSDGSVLYVLGFGGADINQYNLSTNYDISTASFNSIALSVAAQETNPRAMLFNNEGSVLYVMGATGDDVNQYDLSTNYDISTASFNSIALSVAAQHLFPTAMLFNNDGSVLYVVGGGDIDQYNLNSYPEVAANNGTIDNTNAFTITLSGDTFTGTNGSDLVADAKVSIGNVPTGLTAVLTKDSDTQVSLTFTGAATSHQSANNVSDLTFAFVNTAFTTTAATSVANSGAASPFSSNVGIAFLDNTATVEFSADTADDENVGANLPQLLVTGTVSVSTTVTITNAGTGSTNTGDYTFASPVTVTIPTGSYDGTLTTAVTITGLSITGDTVVETDETIDFILSNPTGDVIIGDVNADSTTDTNLTYTITNDDVTLDINDFEIGYLKLFPNPAKNEITLVNKQNIALQKLDIYDITGRLIDNFDMRNSSTETVLDVSQLSSGNYIIIISGKDGGRTTKKLIIE